MAAPWQNDTLGAFGSASQIPSNEWFPVNTQTGQWGTPTPTLASDAGIPDLIPTRTMAPVPAMGGGFGGLPDQAPLSIGQASGTMAPPMTTPRSMQRVQRLDEMGGLPEKRTGWGAVLHAAAQGLAMATPEGRQMMQYADQQRQQQLQNQLTMRRQMLQEEQNERAEIRDDFNTLVQLSNVKSKALRNLYTDRWVADMQAKGKTLPADFIETFKKTGIDEGKQMAQLMEPLITQSGLDPTIVVQMLQEGRDPKEILQLMELAEKQKKTRLDEAEGASIAQQRQQLFGTGTVGDASGVPAPATPGAPTPAPATGTRQPAAAPGLDTPAPIHRAIVAEANRQGVDPQVILALVNQESRFDIGAVGRGGEVGLFQFTEAAAKDMGTTKEALRNNPGLQIEKGIGFFKQKLEQSKGVLNDALTRYNGGGDPNYVANVTQYLPQSRTLLSTLESGQPQPPTARTPAGQPPLTAQRPDTSMMVAGGTGAPAPTQPAPPSVSPQDQAQLARLDARIAGIDQYITANLGSGKERTKAFVNELQQERTRLVSERNQLTEPARAGARTRVEAEVKADVEERVKGRQTAAEVLGDRVTTFFDKATGEQESPGQSMTEMRSRLSEKKVAVLSTDQAKQLSVLKQLEPVLDGYRKLVTYAYGEKGPLKDYARQPFQTVQAMYDQVAQKDPQFQALRRSLEGQLQSVVRALGSRGDLNAQELDAAKGLLANFDASLGLGLSLGPMFGSSGMGVGGTIKPSISMPDTPQTGMRVANELFDLVNKRIGSLLGNPGYTKNALLEVPETPPPNPDDPAYGFGYIPKEVMEQKLKKPAVPPPTPPAAASGQRALKAMTPAQLRQLPDALARAVIATPGMEQALSPEQMDALADGMERWEQSQARR